VSIWLDKFSSWLKSCILRAREGRRASTRVRKGEASGELSEVTHTKVCVEMRVKEVQIEGGRGLAYMLLERRGWGHACANGVRLWQGKNVPGVGTSRGRTEHKAEHVRRLTSPNLQIVYIRFH
jgi:hypothetical protein